MSPILVIGSVHLDIVADLGTDDSPHVDKVGVLTYAVGGTAFNVAANLAYQRRPVLLYSAINSGGFTSALIRKEFARRGMSTALLHEDAAVPESAYVAHAMEGEVIAAVSCSGVHVHAFNIGELTHAIRRCCLVALECNLSTDQINQIVAIAKSLDKRVCVAAVSESKVLRIVRRITHEQAFCVVLLNEREARAAVGHAVYDSTCICSAFSAEYVVVTRGKNGYTVMSSRQERWDYRAPKMIVVSTFGAGDASFAAFCAHFSTRNYLDSACIAKDVRRFLVPVLGSATATLAP